MRVTWNASSGATSDEVWRDTNSTSAGSTRIAASVTGTAYNDFGAVSGTTYWYWVKAKNSGGTSGFSNGNAGHAAVPQPPPAPENTFGSINLTDRIEVFWTSVPEATSYELWRRPDINNSTGAVRIQSNLTGTNYTDTSAQVGRWYYYFTKAKNAEGTSGFSPNPIGANGGRIVP